MKNTYSILVFIMLAIILMTCQKDDPETKNYGSLFKNTVWTGDFNVTNGSIQPVSIVFNENGSMIWYELIGEASGSWILEYDKLMVNFPSGSNFSAKISEDNKLTSITNGATNGWILNNAELNKVPDDVLANTNWQGDNSLLNFLVDNKVKVQLAGAYYDATYTKKYKFVSSKSFNNIFMVRISNSDYKGVYQILGDSKIYPLEVSKQ